MTKKSAGCLPVILVLLIITIGSFFTKWSIPGYSEGTRTGKLIKFSKKGVFCKTWEGSIMIGETAGSNFHFTVMNGRKDIVDSLQAWIGKKIHVKYQQQFASSSCKGDTNYYPIDVKRLE